MNELTEEKHKFQLERMILFSDAVFAIAITLLVLEIRVPEMGEPVSDKLLLEALGHLIPKFIGFVLSFLLIGQYWMVHHRIFGLVTSYTPRLLWLNMFFLFFIVLMPFSNAFYSEYAGVALLSEHLMVPMAFYVLNFCGVGFMNFIIWRYIGNLRHGVIPADADMNVIRMGTIRSVIVPVIFVLMLLVAFSGYIRIAVYVPALIPVAIGILSRRYKKKHGLLLKQPPAVSHQTVTTDSQTS